MNVHLDTLIVVLVVVAKVIFYSIFLVFQADSPSDDEDKGVRKKL